MIRGLTFALCGLLSTAAIAEECRDIVDSAKRLSCYDRQDKKSQEDKKKADEESNSWILQNLTVRDTTGPNAKDSASLSITRSGGDTNSVTKLGATLDLGQTGLPDMLKDRGWSWYLSAALNKDTGPKQPTDARNFELGTSGNFFNRTTDHFSLLTQASLNAKDDKVAGTFSYGVALDTTLLLKPGILERGLPYAKDQSAYFIKPHFGVFYDDFSRVKTGSTAGTANGAHANIDIEYYPGGNLWRFKLYTDSKRALDLNTSSGMTPRYSTYNKIGIDYALIDPHATDSIVKPSLAIERIIGSYFPDGTQLTTQTRLMLKLKVN